MNVTLQKPELQRYLDEQVKSGNFPSPEAVVEDALMRVMQDDGFELSDEDVAAIKLSEQQLDRGEGISSKDVAARMRQMYGTSRK